MYLLSVVRSDEVINRVRKREMHPFAVVTCRAVAPMTKLSGWTLPLLKPTGRLIALKGRSAQAELDKASGQISRYGGRRPRVWKRRSVQVWNRHMW